MFLEGRLWPLWMREASCPRCHLPSSRRAVPAPPAPAAVGCRGLMDGLFGNPWPDSVHTLPEGVEVPHALLMFPCQHFVSQAFGQSAFPSARALILEESRPQIRGEDGAARRGGPREFTGRARAQAAGLSSLQHAGGDRPMIQADPRRKGHDVLHKLLPMRRIEILVLLPGAD